MAKLGKCFYLGGGVFFFKCLPLVGGSRAGKVRGGVGLVLTGFAVGYGAGSRGDWFCPYCVMGASWGKF